jgi:hypothetical protein
VSLRTDPAYSPVSPPSLPFAALCAVQAGHTFRDYTSNHKTMKTDLDPALVVAAIQRGLHKRRAAQTVSAALVAFGIAAPAPAVDVIVMYT